MPDPLDRRVELRRINLTQPGGRDRVSAATLVVAIGGLMLLSAAGLLTAVLPAIQQAREAARMSACNNALLKLGQAEDAYSDAHHELLPPVSQAKVSDPAAVSWRVNLLPLLDHKPLFARYDFGRPADRDPNQDLMTARPEGYRCFGNRTLNPKHASYVKPVGPGTCWNADGTRDQPLDRQSVTDGLSTTIHVVERAHRTPVWTMSIDTGTGFTTTVGGVPVQGNPLASSPHKKNGRGAQLLLCDGSTRFFLDKIDPRVVQAYLSPDGGERLSAF